MDNRFNSEAIKYREAATNLPGSIIDGLQDQYIANQILKEGGLINKYLKEMDFPGPTDQGIQYLKGFLKHPMRYIFFEIMEELGHDLYEVWNPFTEEELLVYSPAMTTTIKEAGGIISIWLIMGNYNGKCFETYGPVIPFKALTFFDIDYFALHNNFNLYREKNGISKDLNQNPVPYLMLVNGCELAMIANRGEDFLYFLKAKELNSLPDHNRLKKNFAIEYKEDIYKLTPHGYGEFPHFARAYFIEESSELKLLSFSETGFEEMIKAFEIHGITVEDNPDFILHPYTPNLTSMILDIDASPDQFVEIFEDAEGENTPEEDEQLESLNELMGLIVEAYNNGIKPNLKKYADEVGVPEEVAEQLYKVLKDKIGQMDDPGMN